MNAAGPSVAIATSQHVIAVYLVYTAASLGLTIWLARTLFKNGEVFLEEVFADNPRMASAVNRLLVVGFYLINLGYAFLTLNVGREALTPTQAIETLAGKLGGLLLALGLMHFGNLYLFHRVRRRGRLRLAPPPVEPQLRHHGGGGAATAGMGVGGTAAPALTQVRP
jgi:hypothetical protein